MEAKARTDLLVIDSYNTDGQSKFLSFRMTGEVSYGYYSYEEFKEFPQAVEYNGEIYGKRGWNSESGRVFYRTGVPLAKIVPSA